MGDKKKAPATKQSAQSYWLNKARKKQYSDHDVKKKRSKDKFRLGSGALKTLSLILTVPLLFRLVITRYSKTIYIKTFFVQKSVMSW